MDDVDRLAEAATARVSPILTVHDPVGAQPGDRPSDRPGCQAERGHPTHGRRGQQAPGVVEVGVERDVLEHDPGGGPEFLFDGAAVLVHPEPAGVVDRHRRPRILIRSTLLRCRGLTAGPGRALGRSINSSSALGTR